MMLKIPFTRVYRPLEAGLFLIATTVSLFFAIFLSPIGQTVLFKLQLAANEDVFTSGPLAGWYTKYSLQVGLTRVEAVSLALAVCGGVLLTCVTIIMQTVGWTVKAAGIFIFSALNGSPLSRRNIFYTAARSVVALALICFAIRSGFTILNSLFFLTYFLLSFLLGIWRLNYTPNREMFGPLARQRLAEAWRGSKVLCFAAIFVLVLGGPIIKAAHKDAPIMQLIVIIVGASVLLFFVIKIIDAVQAALTIARDERRLANLHED